MTIKAPFAPVYNTGVTVTAGASATTTVRSSAKQLCITNLGATNAGYISVSTNSTVTASAADYPVPPGSQVVVTKGEGLIYVATFSAGTDLHIIAGEGF